MLYCVFDRFILLHKSPMFIVFIHISPCSFGALLVPSSFAFLTVPSLSQTITVVQRNPEKEWVVRQSSENDSLECLDHGRDGSNSRGKFLNQFVDVATARGIFSYVTPVDSIIITLPLWVSLIDVIRGFESVLVFALIQLAHTLFFL